MGLLELLWHYTAEFSPRGNVGKYTDSAIAKACHWPKDPTVFVKALTDTGWLDMDEEYRLLVHDWADHVDETTKKRLLRAKQEIIVRQPNGNRTATERQTESPPEAANGSLARGKARQGTGKAQDKAVALLDDFAPFLEASTACSLSVNPADLEEAKKFWRRLDFDQKTSAVRGLWDRLSGGEYDDPQYRPLPQTYLEKTIWHRPIRVRSVDKKGNGPDVITGMLRNLRRGDG